MAADFVKFFVLLVFVAVDSANAQNYEGDNCVLRRTGASGVCRTLRTCVSARNDLRKGLIPQNCGYAGTVPIVCCVPETPVTPPTPAPTFAPQVVVTSAPGSTKCPDYPPEAITARKTGEKAWDYCIDLASTVYPCSKKGFLFNSPMVRSYDCAHSSTPLIVGGSPATAGEFPHMALLGFSNDPIQWDCGGTLISKDWIMTAAHCIFKRDTGNVTHIRLGGGDSNSTLEPEFYYRVAEIVPHPGFIAPSVYNDIALLKTDRSAIFSAMVRPACLHTGNSINDTRIIATGWGTTASRGVPSHSLLKVTLEKFSYAECSTKNPPSRRSKDGVRDSTQFCAGHHTEIKDACQGDSGGPLQIYNNGAVECTYLVMAVTSNGKVCGVPGQPAMYTRVSAFLPWIEGIVWPNGI